ncbi:hypothetical protein OPT61_g9070 [Boeremia exigua]|uniref:Uncharacterized protein n=1 Tax=Boeremia exigua TaxID=749465 RepID=A0ACC2HVW0_9PLEO|nr:hypothetical protein OPT61_g9070 [Boeremia exigua]
MVIINALTKGISASIALAGEKYYDHKDRKAVLANQRNEVDVESGGDTAADDERIWALDEAAPPPAYEDIGADFNTIGVQSTVSDLVHDVTEARRYDNEVEDQNRPSIRLPYPVIIPQRRPGTKLRGWARAYPPDLQGFGIEQETFLKFLQNFEVAQQASPWLKAVYIGANIVGLVPGTITMAVSLSVTIAAGTAIELQGRYKANNFLDQMNRDVFMPLGLYVMVLMHKDTGNATASEIEVGIEDVGMATAQQISKSGLPKGNENDSSAQSTSGRLFRPIRLASGKTNTDTMPLNVAPLIYPGLDDMLERPHVQRDENTKARLIRNKEFVADYLDRRTRAEYAGNNPNSKLTKAAEGDNSQEFRTRFADPNHPCNNGHLLSLITGGKIVAQPLGMRRGTLRQVGADGKLKPAPKGRGIRGPVSAITYPLRKVMTPNILYLTIVNLPSEQEMAEARHAMDLDDSKLKDILAQYMAKQ